MEALRKELKTNKLWLEEVEEELLDLQSTVESYQKAAALKEDHVEDLKEYIKSVEKKILEI